MDYVRGILLVGVGAFVLIRGIVTHGRPNSGLAIGLGLAAIALGIWRLVRKQPQRKM
jgi:hypothetical protein